jgi:DNA-binding response OmpR family regulator
MPSESMTSLENTATAHEEQDDVYDDGYLRVEHTRFYAVCGGKPLFNLTRKEFLLLSRLVRDGGRPVAKQDLWASAWGQQIEFNRNTFRVHVANLRRKLSPLGLDVVVFVQVGYRLARAGDEQMQEKSVESSYLYE